MQQSLIKLIPLLLFAAVGMIGDGTQIVSDNVELYENDSSRNSMVCCICTNRILL